MANIKSNIKSFRKNSKRKIRNKSEISACKTKIKVATNSKAAKDISQVYKKIDSIASKGKIHKNKANRMKSRLTKKLNKK